MTVCERLKETRESRGISLEEAALASRIPQRFILALENENFRALGGRVYALNYGRQYASYLGVADQAWYGDLICAWETYQLKSTLPLRTKRTAADLIARLRPKNSTVALMLGAAILVIGYLGYQLSYLMRRPVIEIAEPRAVETLTDKNTATVSGRILREASLTVNNRPVVVNPDETFAVRLFLLPGVNTIELTAENLAGKTVRLRRYITYDP